MADCQGEISVYRSDHGGFLFSLKESLVLPLLFLTIFLHFPQPFNFFAYFCCKNINQNMNNNTYEKP